MSFSTDNGGKAVRINDAKISFDNGSTWATRLSQIANIKGNIYISTFSLPDLVYVERILGKRPSNIYILAHKKFTAKANDITRTFPDIHIALRNDIHAKFVLIEPKTVWLSSANFGRSGWIEHSIGIHSEEVLAFYRYGFVNCFNHSESCT